MMFQIPIFSFMDTSSPPVYNPDRMIVSGRLKIPNLLNSSIITKWLYIDVKMWNSTNLLPAAVLGPIHQHVRYPACFRRPATWATSDKHIVMELEMYNFVCKKDL